MKTMKVIIQDVELTFDEDISPTETKVGVLEGEWDDGMMDTNLDAEVYFFFDDVSEMVEGAELGDGTFISKIYGEPYERAEKYTSEQGLLSGNI